VKTIDLANTKPTLIDILALASEDDIIVRTQDGREFVVTEVDDFAKEVEAVRNNPELMEFLDKRFKEKGKYSLEEAKRLLDLAD
jgi:hypothetical protein